MGAEPVLHDSARALFEPFAFGTLSTTNPDHSPQVTLVAAFLDGHGDEAEIVLFHRGWYQKLRNIGRNPNVALTIVPANSGPGRPGALPPYLVVHGTARVQEGDAEQWSDRLLAVVAASLPPGTDLTPPPMPANGGWTTHITPSRVVGVGPWAGG